MTDIRPASGDILDAPTLVRAVYGLSLAGFVTFGVTALIAAVLAVAGRGSAPDWARTHFEFQLRSLAVLAAGAPIGVLLVRADGLGIFLLAVLAVWFGLRMVLGLNRATRGESYPSPRTWLV